MWLVVTGAIATGLFMAVRDLSDSNYTTLVIQVTPLFQIRGKKSTCWFSGRRWKPFTQPVPHSYSLESLN